MKTRSFLERNNILDFITEYNMLLEDDRVIVGVSGGPDSVCLLLLLSEIQKLYNLTIQVVHINHMIRGEAADADERFVKALCSDLSIDCVSYSIDIPSLAKISGRSLEEEARIARYDKLKEVAGASGKIAIAHNADDNAETVLFHLIRGCGLDGACGIAPVNNIPINDNDDSNTVTVIRPLLRVRKKDIVAFLQDLGQNYCVDHTNQENEYSRNAIRNIVLPALEQINTEASTHISDFAFRMSQTRDYLATQVNLLQQEIIKYENNKKILIKEQLSATDKLVARQVLKEYLSSYMPDQKDVSAYHINKAMEFLNSTQYKTLSLPYGYTLTSDRTKLWVIQDKQNREEKSDFGHISIRQFPYTKDLVIPTKTYTKWFDYDKIYGDVVFRSRQPGDYLVINDQGGTKKLQDYFTAEHIPATLRDEVMLVCENNHVLWVIGHRISAYYKVTDATTNIMEITYHKEGLED